MDSLGLKDHLVYLVTLVLLVGVEIRAHLVEMERMDLMEILAHLVTLETEESQERMVYQVLQVQWAKRDPLEALDLPDSLDIKDRLGNKATL